MALEFKGGKVMESAVEAKEISENALLGRRAQKKLSREFLVDHLVRLQFRAAEVQARIDLLDADLASISAVAASAGINLGK